MRSRAIYGGDSGAAAANCNVIKMSGHRYSPASLHKPEAGAC